MLKTSISEINCIHAIQSSVFYRSENEFRRKIYLQEEHVRFYTLLTAKISLKNLLKAQGPSANQTLNDWIDFQVQLLAQKILHSHI